MNTKSDLQPGDLVSVRFGAVLRHYGVVTFGGQIVSNNGAYGGVVSQSYDEFSKGREVTIHPRNSDTCEYAAHHRAHKRLGHDYDLAGSNCIDFVRHARGEGPSVTQYARATLKTLGDMFGPKRRW